MLDLVPVRTDQTSSDAVAATIALVGSATALEALTLADAKLGTAVPTEPSARIKSAKGSETAAALGVLLANAGA